MIDDAKKIAVLERRLSELLGVVRELAQGQRKLMNLVHLQKLARDANNLMFENLIAKIATLEERIETIERKQPRLQ